MVEIPRQSPTISTPDEEFRQYHPIPDGVKSNVIASKYEKAGYRAASISLTKETLEQVVHRLINGTDSEEIADIVFSRDGILLVLRKRIKTRRELEEDEYIFFDIKNPSREGLRKILDDEIITGQVDSIAFPESEPNMVGFKYKKREA